jgi:hypothetical protein
LATGAQESVSSNALRAHATHCALPRASQVDLCIGEVLHQTHAQLSLGKVDEHRLLAAKKLSKDKGTPTPYCMRTIGIMRRVWLANESAPDDECTAWPASSKTPAHRTTWVRARCLKRQARESARHTRKLQAPAPTQMRRHAK